MTRPGFTGSPLDRADHIRTRPDDHVAAVAHPEARLLRLDGVDPIIEDGGLAWQAIASATPADALLLLGLLGGVPHFAGIPAERPTNSAPYALWTVLGEIAPEDAAIYGIARSLLLWHGSHRFCANCGAATAVFRAGWGRHCGACDTDHFPRVDPVVIMLAEHDGKILVGRQPSWPEARYSALAGFLEPGESIEEAVGRELHEEAGVVTERVRYIASQPWPYPSQLMIAAIAEVASAEIVLDRTELEEAIWLDRAEVAAALAGDPRARFLPPPPFAIAHTLLAAWVNGS